MEPGWRNDPYGRYQQRWWDGAEFTDRVRTGDDETTDPLGATPSIPFVTPDTALAPPPGRVARFLQSLGPDARRRPSPRLGLALAGIGGAIASAGAAALITGEEGHQGRGVVAGLIVLANALCTRLFVRCPESVRSAAVGAGAVGIVVTVAAITSKTDSGTWPLLLLAAVLLAAWVLPGFRGRPLMLGLAAAALVAGLVSAVDGGGSDDPFSSGGTSIASDGGWSMYPPDTLPGGLTYEECDRILMEDGFDAMPDECFYTPDPVYDDGSFDDGYYDDGGYSMGPSLLFPFGFGTDTTQQGTVALLSGAVLMGGVLLLDRRRWHGIATSLVPAGVVASTVGLGLLVTDFDSTAAGALLATAVGALVAGVGSAGDRRATTWWGAALASLGSIAFVVSLVEPSSFNGGAVTVLCVGLLLAGVPTIIGRVRATMARTSPTEETS
jgi:hypothetical protein